jgi:hypothetical protein
MFLTVVLLGRYDSPRDERRNPPRRGIFTIAAIFAEPGGFGKEMLFQSM